MLHYISATELYSAVSAKYDDHSTIEPAFH